MRLILMIAWRNILRHRGKSYVIGAILFLGALLMAFGNAVISGMDKGLQEHIVNGFTGDIVLVSAKQESDNVFIEFMGKAVEPIHNFTAIKPVLDKQPFIEKYLPIGKNTAMVLNEDGAPGYAYLIGVDFEQYRAMFPDNIMTIQGSLPDRGERGLLVATGARKEFYDYTGIWFKAVGAELDTADMPADVRASLAELVVKDSAVLMGFNNDNSTSDIRLGITGIIKYRALNSIWGSFVLTDIESYRECLGYFSAADKSASLTEEEKSLLESEDIDALFSEGEFFTDGAAKKKRAAQESPDSGSAANAQAAPADVDAGTYNMVLVKTRAGEPLDKTVAGLNSALSEAGLDVRALTWKKAIGPIGSMSVVIKGALFVFVMLLFFVAIIIIVNTLSMAAIERTSEIGMMRAVGARKGFIRLMFLGETAMLSAVFGGTGIFVGRVAARIVELAHITTTNDMVQLLYGGDTFQPFLSAGDLFMTLLQLVLVTLIAVAYPIRVAGSITPLDAVSRE